MFAVAAVLLEPSVAARHYDDPTELDVTCT